MRDTKDMFPLRNSSFFHKKKCLRNHKNAESVFQIKTIQLSRVLPENTLLNQSKSEHAT